jgi:hypothetical protein
MGRSKRRALSVVEKVAIRAKSNGRCFYCGATASKDLIGRPSSWHMDHHIPLDRGGPDEVANIVLACSLCNGMKQNRMPEDFRRYLGNHLASGVEDILDAVESLRWLLIASTEHGTLAVYEKSRLRDGPAFYGECCEAELAAYCI